MRRVCTSVPRRPLPRYAVLVDGGRLPDLAFDEAYAVARLTPGTNLLAMYTLLGERFAGWRGAFTALTVGTLIPALIAVTLGAAYVGYAGHPLAEGVMQGARAGALAVFAWAIVRLGRPQLQQHRSRGVVLAFVTLVMTLLVPVPQFVILLVAGGGPVWLPRRRAPLTDGYMVVAGCGVLALLLSTIGVYGMIADTRQIRMRSIWSSANGIGRTIMRTRPCRQWWQGWRGSLDLDECRRPSAIHAVQSPDLA